MTMLRRTLFESFLISVVIGAVLLFVPRPEAEAQQGGPTVTVTTGNPTPSAGLPGTKFTTSLGASVDDEPDIGDECTLNGPTWSWSVTSVERGDAANGPWTVVTGENVSIEHTNPNSASAKLIAIFSSSGYWRVTVTATASWSSPDCAAPPPVSGSKPVKMQVVNIQLKDVTYGGGGYQALYNSSDSFRDEGSALQTGPHFVVDPPSVQPACFKWKSSPRITATFKVVPPLSSGSISAKFKATLTTTSQNNILNYLQSATISGSTFTVTMNTSNDLKKRVEATVMDIPFEVSTDNGATYRDCGRAIGELLVVVGTATRPRSELEIVGQNRPTIKRIRWCLQKAEGGTTEKEVVDNLWKKSIGTNFDADGVVDGTSPIWQFIGPLGEAPALECRGQAIMEAAAVAILGVEPLGQVVYVYPLEASRRPNGQITKKNAGERAFNDPVRRKVKQGNRFVSPHTQDHKNHGAVTPLNSPQFTEFLGYVAGDFLEGAWNSFEACFKFQGVYYAGGIPNQTFADVRAVMTAVATNSYFAWWEIRPHPKTRLPTKTALVCTNPGPNPETPWD